MNSERNSFAADVGPNIYIYIYIINHNIGNLKIKYNRILDDREI